MATLLLDCATAAAEASVDEEKKYWMRQTAPGH